MTEKANVPNRRPRTGLTNDSVNGRVLQALRAGVMTVTELRERFPTSNLDMAGLVRAGLVIKFGDGDKGAAYEITDAGRAACPLRNPTAANPRPAPAGALTRSKRVPIF